MGKSTPPITAANIYQSADRLLKKHGHDAVTVASMRAEESLGQGDMDGYRTWKRIVMVVDELTSLSEAERFRPH